MTRILLLGELSGVHQELAPALRARGHEVVVGHSRLAQPGFESDIAFYQPSAETTGPMSWARDIGSQIWHSPEMTGFDVVQMITPKFFNWKIHGTMLRLLKQFNRRIVVIATSCSSDYHRRVQDLAYRPCKECLSYDLKSDHCIYNTPSEKRAEYAAFDVADAIVATHYEYAFALADTRFAAKITNIPLPIDTRRHFPAPMPSTDKVRIWYGETRYGFKGSHFILPALERLQDSPLGDKIEICRTGRLAFSDYLDFLNSLHIVIDQASSIGMGMNALYAMARGRVALTGAEPETLEFIGISAADNPMINIRPDSDQIFAMLHRLVKSRSKLPALGRMSAAYIAKYHAADVIAKRYEELYERLL